ncbi:MAG: Type III restriction enzyme, res subunit [Candidatus Gottesmanbacteria bacterium GW2011_GWB1_43_11]|uniref:Type III restriction enzyme, res subunit n=1 Tax=Candidatus Gottesmanbacteria bacterium GW2011_GWB1_43_11 TaxID=1618446 RepID=A0A0G1EW05_9BACT|nr:MAG: Type III restriction enzyme, res subunit [Candidatus Gottesmanbacteria bacterium GW2011_GWA2_42_16]KKS56157.1 MAG: Type III restriction enzyme, res subunit [Candidatus Gottesmanbacteria bacterium GW2011_GWA1_42_26]KKS82478.1 MAG: Type III restriction enzyme, res subunit [Candidatus Gottesmanbacteria bacterium GW2011_GWC1_43_10]KKS87201.1 MAG: Type III restriction enzyme, res subunit [Candidatus Gottesmanbacteria bacterium GW2011_GWB1_43_11]OGG08478.1 MAG: hypothetical protein A2699_0529
MITIIPEQIALYRSFFNTRTDVFAKYWVDLSGKKSGYSPVYRLNQSPQALTDMVIISHLQGNQTIGVYPLFPDNTTAFLAIDFDGSEWLKTIQHVVTVTQDDKIPIAIERSRSGNGAHIWFFFTNPIPAYLARQFGRFILNQSGITTRKTFDRLFPSQDEHTGKGYGNLICLPLQGKLASEDKTVFITPNGNTIPDQWHYLAQIRKISVTEIQQYISNSNKPVIFNKEQISAPQSNQATHQTIEESNETQVVTTQGQQTKLILGSQIFIPNIYLPDKLHRFLKSELNFPNPEYFTKERFGYSTWQTPRFIKTIEVHPDGITIPLGLLDQVMKFINQEQLQVEITDKRITTKPVSFPSTIKLRKDQQQILHELLTFDRSILQAHPGFGKTMVALYLMKKRRQKTLIIVHTNTLLYQWHKRITEYFSLKKDEVGIIGDNKWNIGKKVTIASYMTLSRRGVKEIKDNFGFVIVDECHHVPANTFSTVVKQFPANYMLGLTATTYRKDKLEKLMFLYISNHTVPAKEQTPSKQPELSSTVETQLLTRKTEFEIHSKVDDFQEISRFTIVDDKRNNQITRDIAEVLATGAKCLVLTERLEHSEKLLELVRTKTKGIHAAVATGVMTKKQRERITKRMSQERFQLLIATGKLIGEGFDWPAVSHLFLAFPFSWKGRLIQYVGRVQRNSEGKILAVVHDYFDDKVPMLKLMYFKRLRTYRSLGLTKIGNPQKHTSLPENQLSLFG